MGVLGVTILVRTSAEHFRLCTDLDVNLEANGEPPPMIEENREDIADMSKVPVFCIFSAHCSAAFSIILRVSGGNIVIVVPRIYSVCMYCQTAARVASLTSGDAQSPGIFIFDRKLIFGASSVKKVGSLAINFSAYGLTDVIYVSRAARGSVFRAILNCILYE
jgi:hypothetical protein